LTFCWSHVGNVFKDCFPIGDDRTQASCSHIHTVSDLLDYSKENLLEIKNFGKKSAKEVVEALQNRLGIELPN
jgi:ERCC4-type nuclease